MGSRPGAGRRGLTLVVLCAGQLMIVLDATVVTVALPAIQRDLGFSQAALAWVVNGYLITFGGLLLLAGRVGDLLGRRRVLLAGLLLFTAASVLCGLAPSQELLIAARFVQGVGAAAVSSMVLAVLVLVFPEPAQTARAMSVYAFVASSGGALGLLAGGVLTEALSWHWIFLVNLPLGVVAAALGAALVPRDAGEGLGRGVDLPGAVLVTAAPSLAVFTILRAGDGGWLSTRTAGLALLTVLATAAFLLREASTPRPLVPLRILRSRTLVAADVLRALFPVGLFGTFFLGALYVQQVLGYAPLQAGAAFLPQSVAIGLISLAVTRRVVDRVGSRVTLIAGLVLVTVGLLLFARAPERGSYLVDVLPVTLLVGAGAGLFFMPSLTLAMTGVARSEVGLASGLANVALQLGAAVGVAVLASASSGRAAGLVAAGTTREAALTAGYHLGFLIGAGSLALAVGVAVLVLGPGPSPATRPAGAPTTRRGGPAPVDPPGRPLPGRLVLDPATEEAEAMAPV